MSRRLALVAISVGLMLLGGCSTEPRVPLRGAEHGIEVVGIRLTGGGGLARLEYRVLDIEKARRALRQDLSIEATGSGAPLPVLSAGRLGALRQRPSATGKKQFVLFRNPHDALRRGETAVLRVGSARVPGVPVS